MGRSQELSEFKRGSVIGCYLCNKSIHDISLLLNIPWLSVSGIKMEATGNNSHKVKCTVHRSRQLSAVSSKLNINTSCGLQITTVHREL
ncbi:unnamed protein product, partial [Staurois parvus]